MSYSFIRPKPKSIFKRYTKIWCFYTILAVLSILAFAKVLELQGVAKINEQTKIQEDIQHTKLKAIVVKDYIERLDYEVNLGKEIQMQNQLLKDGLSNLLGLIPDQIVVKSIELDYNTLAMRGLTPSKEVYKFLLEAPLRAVFTQTKVEFFPLMSGWFNFVSVSKTNPTLKPLKLEQKESNDG
ncbi:MULTISPECIES: hypothetical protein [Helicobacter]|uniref:Putative membrane protein n=2 Tax=Helicobacter typhlonius TaxID=76936 RepID=A0A0S4PWU9_9HELI|nr:MULTISPECIES: hypothetical protein [Helicobacter]TLD78775.1 hypothetical protein LS75_003200 [Helicobacter typhlonius]TLD90110.1 hypothetical protein LS67_000125 [Helicobacter sp. MIT 03-1616]CUU40763.1 Putative membrane protein [Helicobacter typhlonius]HCD72776.1 hypothetical protein [Helicobacter sp.]